MWLTVDPRSPKPVYQQVIESVKGAVAKGLLEHGDRLPSVRELAGMMTLNHNTVARAYQELERDRVIEVVRGHGTFVAAAVRPPDREARVQELVARIREMIVDAHHLQLSEDDLLELVQTTVRAWREERGQPDR